MHGTGVGVLRTCVGKERKAREISLPRYGLLEVGPSVQKWVPASSNTELRA